MVKKEAAIAMVLNFFFPGIGYMYAGRPILGVFVFMLSGVLFITGIFTLGVGFLLLGGLAFIATIDGYLCVKKYNDRIDAQIEASLAVCPHCAEKIQKTAKVCRYCQRPIEGIRAA
jgi:hypothetical protein